ncbi:hypothetical protein E2C01_059256 [Portunus trituberculatus]|uniref:Uncharacterized protein n=1 Tax=Portunus trituberculatus TaxID=210409 RepID=A0A5B7H7U2_PORTR|nr:hypothetical protein [Portunus trituberculatus]
MLSNGTINNTGPGSAASKSSLNISTATPSAALIRQTKHQQGMTLAPTSSTSRNHHIPTLSQDAGPVNLNLSQIRKLTNKATSLSMRSDASVD